MIQHNGRRRKGHHRSRGTDWTSAIEYCPQNSVPADLSQNNRMRVNKFQTQSNALYTAGNVVVLFAHCRHLSTQALGFVFSTKYTNTVLHTCTGTHTHTHTHTHTLTHTHTHTHTHRGTHTGTRTEWQRERVGVTYAHKTFCHDNMNESSVPCLAGCTEQT